VIQLVAVPAVHEHELALAVRVTDNGPPEPATLAAEGERVNVQGGGAAACVTAYVCPPTVTVAVRAAPLLAATVIVTVADPVPLAGATVAQLAVLDAVQPHVDALAATVALSGPPLDPAAPVDGASTNVQAGGVTAWNANRFEGSLNPTPVGPTAETRAS